MERTIQTSEFQTQGAALFERFYFLASVDQGAVIVSTKILLKGSALENDLEVQVARGFVVCIPAWDEKSMRILIGKLTPDRRITEDAEQLLIEQIKLGDGSLQVITSVICMRKINYDLFEFEPSEFVHDEVLSVGIQLGVCEMTASAWCTMHGRIISNYEASEIINEWFGSNDLQVEIPRQHYNLPVTVSHNS